jgi:hypothetical protein
MCGVGAAIPMLISWIFSIFVHGLRDASVLIPFAPCQRVSNLREMLWFLFAKLEVLLFLSESTFLGVIMH